MTPLPTALAATEAARDEQTALASAATKDTTHAQAAAHTAELLATEAQATCLTLPSCTLTWTTFCPP